MTAVKPMPFGALPGPLRRQYAPMKAPELLLPAGSLTRCAPPTTLAPMPYAGQPRYSLRARNNEFRLEQLAQGIAEAHARGKKFFVTSNLIAHNDKLRTYRAICSR